MWQILLPLLLWFVPQQTHADIEEPVRIEQIAVIAPVSIPKEQDYSTTTLRAYAVAQAKEAGINPTRFANVLNCESRFIFDAKGDYVNGKPTSFGVSQLHYPERDWGISTSTALDPYRNIDIAVDAWKRGEQWRWSCFQSIYGK